MPNPDQYAQESIEKFPGHMFARMGDAREKDPANQADVRELIEKVDALVRLLQPPSAVILTGMEVQRQFSQLHPVGCGDSSSFHRTK